MNLRFYSAPDLKGKSGEPDIGLAALSPADGIHLAMSESGGFLGGNGSAGNTGLTGLLPGKKKIALILGLSSTAISTLEAAQEK